MLALALAGCRAHTQPTIVVIVPTGGLDYWGLFYHEARKEATAAGMRCEIEAPQEESDHSAQVRMVEAAIGRHVQGIIVAPTHQLVLASSLQRAMQAHIPVILVGAASSLPSEDYTASVSWDAAEAGRLAARRMVAALGGHGEVAMVGVSPTVEGSSEIEKAFSDEISHAPGIRLVGVQYGLSDWARSRQVVLDLRAEHPALRGILTTDEFSTHAASYAFDKSDAKKPVLIGVSTEANEVMGLYDKRVQALVVSDAHEMAQRAMSTLNAALAGSDGGRQSSQLPVYLIDGKTIDRLPFVERLKGHEY